MFLLAEAVAYFQFFLTFRITQLRRAVEMTVGVSRLQLHWPGVKPIEAV